MIKRHALNQAAVKLENDANLTLDLYHNALFALFRVVVVTVLNKNSFYYHRS